MSLIHGRGHDWTWCSPDNLVHSVCESWHDDSLEWGGGSMARKRYSVERIVAAVKAQDTCGNAWG